jgi:hypothetical protein
MALDASVRSPIVNTQRLILAVLATLSIAACSGPQVRSLGNGAGAPAYELRGTSLSAIEAEASRLCSRGFEVLRSSQNFATSELDDNAGTQFLLEAGAWLSGMPGNQAQATIVCRA